MKSRAPRPYGIMRSKSPRRGSSIPSHPDAWGSRIAMAQRKAEREAARLAGGGSPKGGGWFGGGGSGKNSGEGAGGEDSGAAAADDPVGSNRGPLGSKKTGGAFSTLVALNPLNILAGGNSSSAASNSASSHTSPWDKPVSEENEVVDGANPNFKKGTPRRGSKQTNSPLPSEDVRLELPGISQH